MVGDGIGRREVPYASVPTDDVGEEIRLDQDHLAVALGLTRFDVHPLSPESRLAETRVFLHILLLKLLDG